MKRWYTGVFFSLIIVIATLLTTGQAAQAFATQCGAWSIVPSPNIGSYDNLLYGVTAISTNNAWTVGYYDNSSTDLSQTLIEHWNGASWNIVNSPNIAGANDQLNAVVALSNKNAWAVGEYTIGTGWDQTLIEHWNGTSWSIVSSPGPGSGTNDLEGITAISKNNVWAVGSYFNSNVTSETALIEHWNGTSWSVVSGANPETYNELTAVTAISGENIWAVGLTSENGPGQALVEHWNGTNWSVVKSPTPHPLALFYGVAASSASDIWAVGYTPISKTATVQTLIEHWNGSTWKTVSSPNPGSGNDQLSGVAAVSSNNAWAVGYDNYLGTSLIEHWDGAAWSVISNPNPSNLVLLQGVVSIKNTTSLWSVGYYFNNQETTQTLTGFYC